ncbi:MAG: thioredoxin family protein [bacterium]|nr:thioredoxin family protein [bacterium]
MKHLSIATVLLASTALCQTDGAHAAGHWYADFDEAAAAAKKANKDLLVDFTGSDWCGWCIKLDKEVFEHDAFTNGVDPHFVLVALDFPRGEEAKAKVPNPARNKELQSKYGVRGFPTVLLMTADGEVFGKTGYQRGGAETYVESLDKMRTEGKRNLQEVKDLVAKFEAATGPAAKAAITGLAIDKLMQLAPGAIGTTQLADIVDPAVESEDVKLAERAVRALLKSGEAGDSTITKAVELDPKNEKGLFEQVVNNKMTSVKDDKSARAFLAALDKLVTLEAKDTALFEKMLSQAAQWSFGPLGDKDAAKKYAKTLKAKAKDSKKYAKLFEQILGDE